MVMMMILAISNTFFMWKSLSMCARIQHLNQYIYRYECRRQSTVSVWWIRINFYREFVEMCEFSPWRVNNGNEVEGNFSISHLLAFTELLRASDRGDDEPISRYIVFYIEFQLRLNTVRLSVDYCWWPAILLNIFFSIQSSIQLIMNV